MHGFTDNYIRVNVTPDESLTNCLVTVHLNHVNDDLTVDGCVSQSNSQGGLKI